MNCITERLFNELFERYPELECIRKEVHNTYDILRKCYENNGKILVCGNGGSAADAGHMTAELMKGFLLKRPVKFDQFEKKIPENGEYIVSKLQYGLPAISLSAQSELITAIANDIGFDMVFAQQVFAYASPGDVLVSISTSGNSISVINAVIVAKSIGIKTIGFTGSTGGKLKELCDVMLCVPETKTYKIQEHHLPIYHTVCAMLEQTFFEL